MALPGALGERQRDYENAARRAELASQGIVERGEYVATDELTRDALIAQRTLTSLSTRKVDGTANEGRRELARLSERASERKQEYRVVQDLLAGWDAPGVRTQPQTPQRRPQAPRPVGRSPNIVTGILSLLGQANTARRALIGG